MTSRKVLMMKEDEKAWIFLLEDDEIVEIHCDKADAAGAERHVLGNIYVGRVKNIVPNIGAAFIEIMPCLRIKRAGNLCVSGTNWLSRSARRR